MKKINAILHDVTVINFLLIFKLAKRYMVATISAIIIAVVSILYTHFTQIEIHTKKVAFKIKSPDASTATSGGGLASLTADTESSGYFNQNEVMAIMTNYNFLTVVSELLVESPHFSKLDFNGTASKKIQDHAQIFKNCNDKKCNVETIRGIIPGFFTVETDQTTQRTVLNVTTRSTITTLELLKNLKTALIKSRMNAAITSADQSIKDTEDLIEKSKKDIESKGGFEKIAESESLEALIKQHNDRISAISSRLTTERDQYNFQQIRLKESGSTVNTDINSNKKLSYENFTKLTTKIEEIRQNIASINSTPKESRTESDNLVLKQLNSELTKLETDLSKFGPMKRNIAHDDSFINTQINNQINFEFDYKVTSAKLKRIQDEYDTAKKELDGLFNKKAAMENELLHLKPDLEYLKQMEGKLVEAKMAKTALKSDVFFDQFGDDVASYRRSTLIQIIIFCSAVSFFLLFIALIVIYLYDDRIFDSFEIEKCCQNLPVIGEAPTFE